MTVRFYVHSKDKQTVDHALIDSGATENFMTTSFAQQAKLLIQNLPEAQEVFNVDGT